LLDETASLELRPQIVEAAKRYNCHKFLIDMRETKIELETHVIYELPKLTAAAGIHTTQRAIVFSGDPKDYKFFETVASNQGQAVRVFTDVNQAIDWLLT
jgi:hypothetical protein